MLKPEKALANWSELNTLIMQLKEKDIHALLEHEKENKGRMRILMRLYNRFSKLRSTREKVELMSHVKA